MPSEAHYSHILHYHNFYILLLSRCSYIVKYAYKRVSFILIYMYTSVTMHSRFAFAYWVQGAGTADEVADILKSLFRRIGMVPLEIQSDNGAQFTANVVVQVSPVFDTIWVILFPPVR